MFASCDNAWMEMAVDRYIINKSLINYIISWLKITVLSRQNVSSLAKIERFSNSPAEY